MPVISMMLLQILGRCPGYFTVVAFSTHPCWNGRCALKKANVIALSQPFLHSIRLRSHSRTTQLYNQLNERRSDRMEQKFRLLDILQSGLSRMRSVVSLSTFCVPALRRRLSVFTACFLIFFSVFIRGFNGMLPPSAFAASASSTSTAVLTERLLDKTSPSLDAMIDKYIRQHMFDDDLSVLDPVAGTYRESYSDMTIGRYPAALREIVSDALRGTKFDLTPSAEVRPKLDVGAALTSAINFIQKRLGLSEMTATILLAVGFVLAGPSLFLFTGMMVGGISKRNMDKVFKKRYGDTYTVDATIKKEPTVEAPPDEEDDDDDDEDDDEDDEEEDDDGKDKRKK